MAGREWSLRFRSILPPRMPAPRGCPRPPRATPRHALIAKRGSPRFGHTPRGRSVGGVTGTHAEGVAMKRLEPTRPRRLVAFGVLCAALAVGAFLVPSSSQAQANDVSCGDTITTSTTLDSDLVNCPNNGVVIGADNITLDL